MLKSCARCGRIHGYDQCTVKRSYKITDESKLRSQAAWTKKSIEVRKKAQGLCEVCRAEGNITYTGLEVHHIEKVHQQPELLLDNNNLVCLCTRHHKLADAGAIDADYLRKLAKAREDGEYPPAYVKS